MDMRKGYRTGYKNLTENSWKEPPKRDGRLDTRNIMAMSLPRPILAKLRSFGIVHICFLCACSREYLARFTGLNDKQLDSLERYLADFANYQLQPHWDTKGETHGDRLRDWLDSEGETILPAKMGYSGEVFNAWLDGRLKQMISLDGGWIFSNNTSADDQLIQIIKNQVGEYLPYYEFEIKNTNNFATLGVYYEEQHLGDVTAINGDELTDKEFDHVATTQHNITVV